MRDALKPRPMGPISGWRFGPVAVGRTVAERSTRRRALITVAGGALAAFLLDPAAGRARRQRIVRTTTRATRATTRTATRLGRRTAGRAHGIAHRVRHLRDEPRDYDDATLAQKLRSEVLRPSARRTTIGIAVDVADGVATLRGECDDPRMMRSLVRAAERTQGVRKVVNLLHPHGSDAPNKVHAIRASR